MQILHKFMDDLKIEVERLKSEQNFDKAIKLLNDRIEKEPNSFDLLELRGDIYYLMQKFGDALNDFNLILKHNNDNKEIKAKLEMVKQILRFQNLDIFESTNLNLDPWLD